MRQHHEEFKSENTNHNHSNDSGITFSFLDDSKLLASLKINPANSDSSTSLFSRSTIDTNGITFAPMKMHEATPSNHEQHKYSKTESIESKEKSTSQQTQQVEKPNWHTQIENESMAKQAEWLKQIAGPDGTISQQDYLKAVKELADSSSSGTDAKTQQQKWIASSVIYEALKNNGNKPIAIDAILPAKTEAHLKNPKCD